MDDGFQDHQIKKNLNILVIDGSYGFGNGFLIPAGPLRETVKEGRIKADLIIIINEDKKNLTSIFKNKKTIFSQSKITSKLNNQKSYIAFCGLARPEKLFDSIGKDLTLVQKISFADHFSYQEKDLEKLTLLAQKNQSSLITTKKDWVKFSEKYQKEIEYVDYEINLNIKDQKILIEQLTC